MNPDFLAFAFLEYVVFLFSTTCHEAAHALVSHLGGDSTAQSGGQVSLNPLPHIRREPFGMVIMPLLGIATMSGLIGWASAPYDPAWSQRHPKRAALMSLAGPAANFSLALAALIFMRVGLAGHVFVPRMTSESHLVGAATGESVVEGVAVVLSILFYLNLLLGAFNLLPIPPLDGYGALGLFTTEAGALKLQEWRFKFRGVAIIGLLLGWRLVDMVYPPILNGGLRLLFMGIA